MALVATTSASPTVVSGTYTGTTAAQTITIGFAPSWVITWNQTDGDDINFWHVSSLTTFINVASAAATITGAITATDHGFTLPTDADTNENAKVYVFIAGR
jgi:hypothetical protein